MQWIAEGTLDSLTQGNPGSFFVDLFPPMPGKSFAKS